MGRPSTETSRAKKLRAERLRVYRDERAARGETCYYCGIVPTFVGRHADRPSVDHTTARSRGGDDSESNLVYCCHGCNSTKGTRTVAEAYLYLNLRRLGWPRFTAEQVEWMRGRGFDLSQLDASKLHFEEI